MISLVAIVQLALASCVWTNFAVLRCLHHQVARHVVFITMCSFIVHAFADDTYLVVGGSSLLLWLVCLSIQVACISMQGPCVVMGRFRFFSGPVVSLLAFAFSCCGAISPIAHSHVSQFSAVSDSFRGRFIRWWSFPSVLVAITACAQLLRSTLSVVYHQCPCHVLGTYSSFVAVTHTYTR